MIFSAPWQHFGNTLATLHYFIHAFQIFSTWDHALAVFLPRYLAALS
jgi:hypothetical protein